MKTRINPEWTTDVVKLFFPDGPVVAYRMAEMGEFFDTHVHLDFLRPDDFEKELKEASRAGVAKFLVPGVDLEHWEIILGMAGDKKNILAAPGLHPRSAGQWDESVARNLKSLLHRPGVAAMGEIGLDAFLTSPPLEVQERTFRDQLRLAVRENFPVLIHCRKSTERLLRILREEEAGRTGGIFHAFSGSIETAKKAIDLGFAIAFGGVLTYPEARRAPQVLRALPAEWIVLETDAPDIAPHPFRGENNRPAYLRLIAQKVAEIRGWSLKETARITTENAKRVLRIKEA